MSLLFIEACNQPPTIARNNETGPNEPALQPAGQIEAVTATGSEQTPTVLQETPVRDVVAWEPGTADEETAVTEAQVGAKDTHAGLAILAVGQNGCEAMHQLVNHFSETETTVACHQDMNGYEDFSYRVGTGSADLIVLPTGWFALAARDNALQDLTHFLHAYGHVESLSPALATTLEYPAGAGQLYGVPLQPETHMLVLRQDLFTEAGLRPAASWQELLTQVQTLQARGHPGFVTAWCENTDCRENITAVWQEIIWSLGGTLWDEENNQAVGVLNSAENQTAVSLLHSLQTTNPATASYTMADALTALCEGAASVGLVWTSHGRTLTAPACAQAGNLTFVALPGSDLVAGGSAIGVSPTAVHQEEAFNFINWLMSVEGQKVSGRQEQPEILVDSLTRVHTGRVPPEYRGALDTQIPVLRQAILGQLSAREALDSIAAHQQNVLDNLYLDD